ncbi:U3 snoRNP-associated protein-like YAOH [Phragmites australis]|uniref:U3 snoRNP-associated protein-like YAOH n=1 Tax=Phragmites australis TaxID=29695 RepID=UPI002D77D712|nr:U3 snoRNP-associated protein-like YAOH [Phragmites australis]
MAPRPRKRASRSKPRAGSRRGGGGDEDPFFESEPKRRRSGRDEDIESEDSDDDGVAVLGGGVDEDGEEGGKEEETVGEKKIRMAKEWLKRVTEAANKGAEDEDEDENENEYDGDRRVAEILQRKQLEESGRKRRDLAARVLPLGPKDGFKVLVKHRQPVTAVALSTDSDKGFSASKDGVIVRWDVETGKSEKYLWPSENVLVSHHAKPPLSAKRSKQVLALAVSSDGRYLASGGLDRHIHLWDVRSREHIQAFSGHRGLISCLAFGLDSSELFSGSFDRSIMQWNAEDRTYMNCLYGHQNEILTMDALSKDRLLTVARDRTMHLWKIPEESQLVFRAPAAASLECCCFIDDKEFLSGSDDGSIELWSIMRKKPTHIIRNAHPISCTNLNSIGNDDQELPNENGIHNSENVSSAQSWVSAVAARKGSDLAASGAGNGLVRLWAIEPDSKGIRSLFNLQLDGFVNSLAIAKSGRFIVAGVGQEPRLGRWGRVQSAQNGVAIHAIRLKEEKDDL